MFQVNTYSGGLTVNVEGNKDLLQGNITCSGSVESLSENSIQCKVITLQADPNNTGNILVGNDLLDDTHYAFILVPGGYVTVSVSDISKIYIKGAASNKISYGGEA